MIRLVVFEEFKIIGGVNHRDLCTMCVVLAGVQENNTLHQKNSCGEILATSDVFPPLQENNTSHQKNSCGVILATSDVHHQESPGLMMS